MSALPAGPSKLGVIRFAKDFGHRLDEIMYLLKQTLWLTRETDGASGRRRIQAIRSMDTVLVELTGPPVGSMREGFLQIVLALVPLHTWEMAAIVVDRQLHFLSVDMKTLNYQWLFNVIQTKKLFTDCFVYIRLNTTEQLTALLNHPISERTGALHVDIKESMIADADIGRIACICDRDVKTLPPVSQPWGLLTATSHASSSPEPKK